MKSKLLFGALLGSIALASCTADEDIASVAKQESPIKFAVSMETANGVLTKAEMTDGMKLNFTTGDLMSLYHGIAAPTTLFAGYQNAIYEGTAKDGEALVFTTKSMVLPNGAIMVYPADTIFANNGSKAPVVKIAANQDVKTKELLPFASEILTIGEYDENKAAGTAGYGKYYPIVLKQIGSTLKLVTLPSNTEVIENLPVAPLSVSNVEMTAKLVDASGAFNTAVELTAEDEAAASNGVYSIWTNVSGVNTTIAKESVNKLTTKDVTDNFTAVFSLLPTADDATLADGASIKINTNYGYVELNDPTAKVWNKKNGTDATALTVKEGIEKVLQNTWIANESSKNFKGEKTGGSFYRTVEADMKNLNMNGLHIKNAQHLVDALAVYDAIKESQENSVVFYLDGDADGVFTMTPAATAAYVAHLDMEGAKSITFTPCADAGEACTAVKFTCTEETEVPANIQFGTSVETQLEGTWKYSNKYKKFVNVERLTVLEGATLNMSDTVGGTTEKSFFINNLGTANVSGVTYLETLNMANYGEMNIKTNAELRVKTTLRNRSKSLTDHGKIYNYGVLATVLGTDGEINNWGYIKQMTAASKTYITNNQTSGATFASIYVTWNNELGIIELFDKDDDNYSVSNEENQGFIMITTTAASVKAADFGKEANYVKVAGDCTALDFTPQAGDRVKFIEIASNEEVVWSANGTDKLPGLIMKEGTKMNLKKSNTLNVATAFLKGEIYQGGALTIDSFTGYLGGAPTDQANVIKY